MSTINSPFGVDRQDRTAYIGCMAVSGYAAAQEQGTVQPRLPMRSRRPADRGRASRRPGTPSSARTATSCATPMATHAVLRQCGDNLTRENVMKQAANIHELKLPMLLPGISVSTSADDFAPIKQMQLMKFDGATWRLFGDVISASSP